MPLTPYPFIRRFESTAYFWVGRLMSVGIASVGRFIGFPSVGRVRLALAPDGNTKVCDVPL